MTRNQDSHKIIPKTVSHQDSSSKLFCRLRLLTKATILDNSTEVGSFCQWFKRSISFSGFNIFVEVNFCQMRTYKRRPHQLKGERFLDIYIPFFLSIKSSQFDQIVSSQIPMSSLSSHSEGDRQEADVLKEYK